MEKKWAEEIAREREKDEMRRREEPAKADAQRARQLKTELVAVWCSCFLLVSGLGSVIGIITQSFQVTSARQVLNSLEKGRAHQESFKR